MGSGATGSGSGSESGAIGSESGSGSESGGMGSESGSGSESESGSESWSEGDEAFEAIFGTGRRGEVLSDDSDEEGQLCEPGPHRAGRGRALRRGKPQLPKGKKRRATDDDWREDGDWRAWG